MGCTHRMSRVDRDLDVEPVVPQEDDAQRAIRAQAVARELALIPEVGPASVRERDREAGFARGFLPRLSPRRLAAP